MPGFRFNLQAIGFGIVICDFEMRHQWNIPSKLVDMLDYRLNSINLGYTRRPLWSCPYAPPGWHGVPPHQMFSSTPACASWLVGS